jgi:excisionase family DNA binding protein
MIADAQRGPEKPLLVNLSGATPHQNFEPLLTSEIAAELLDIHHVTLLRWARERRVPHHRIGRKVKFRASELNNWLATSYTVAVGHAAQPERTAA